MTRALGILAVAACSALLVSQPLLTLAQAGEITILSQGAVSLDGRDGTATASAIAETGASLDVGPGWLALSGSSQIEAQVTGRHLASTQVIEADVATSVIVAFHVSGPATYELLAQDCESDDGLHEMAALMTADPVTGTPNQVLREIYVDSCDQTLTGTIDSGAYAFRSRQWPIGGLAIAAHAGPIASTSWR